MATHWLVVGSRRIRLEVADSPWPRLRGLLGRDRIDGALLLRPARSVHTWGMRFAIDVAFCDDELRVLGTSTMSPGRLARPLANTAQIIEAGAGSFAVWGLGIGTSLDVEAVQGKAA